MSKTCEVCDRPLTGDIGTYGGVGKSLCSKCSFDLGRSVRVCKRNACDVCSAEIYFPAEKFDYEETLLCLACAVERSGDPPGAFYAISDKMWHLYSLLIDYAESRGELSDLDRDVLRVERSLDLASHLVERFKALTKEEEEKAALQHGIDMLRSRRTGWLVTQDGERMPYVIRRRLRRSTRND